MLLLYPSVLQTESTQTEICYRSNKLNTTPQPTEKTPEHHFNLWGTGLCFRTLWFGAGVARPLHILVLHLAAVVGQLPLLSALVHVVGPLRAVASASSFTVNEPAPASREGATTSSAVVQPGFLSVAVVVLKDKQRFSTAKVRTLDMSGLMSWVRFEIIETNLDIKCSRSLKRHWNSPGSTSCSWGCTQGPTPPPGGAPVGSCWRGFRCCCFLDNCPCSTLCLSLGETAKKRKKVWRNKAF